MKKINFKYLIQLGIFAMLALIFFKQDFSITINIQDPPLEVFEEHDPIIPDLELINHKEEATQKPDSKVHLTHNPIKVAPNVDPKLRKQLNYVERFGEVARSEMRKFGIPASIKLAQGLLESSAGDSRNAKENNNHFGIKCFSRKCKRGHCAFLEDDHWADRFRKYDSAWESYRAHSKFLEGSRYKHLKKLGTTDYESWAHGLKKAGYATDKNYAKKLIKIIEDLSLYKFDT